MKKQVGRPSDKELYINCFLSTLSYTVKDKQLLTKALNKLKANDILLLSACVSRGSSCDLASFLKTVPAKTAAQLKRYHNVVDIYKHLERNDNELDEITAENQTFN